MNRIYKGKGSPYSITEIGFWSWSGYFAVSLQVTRVINPVVGIRPAVTIATLKRAATNFAAW